MQRPFYFHLFPCSQECHAYLVAEMFFLSRSDSGVSLVFFKPCGKMCFWGLGGISCDKTTWKQDIWVQIYNLTSSCQINLPSFAWLKCPLAQPVLLHINSVMHHFPTQILYIKTQSYNNSQLKMEKNPSYSVW